MSLGGATVEGKVKLAAPRLFSPLTFLQHCPTKSGITIPSKTSIATVGLCRPFRLSSRTYRHLPVLGVNSTAIRKGVQHPSINEPYGNANLAATSSSTAVPASANSTFAATIVGINVGVDGSSQVMAQINADGTNKKFVAAEVLQNGGKNPTSKGSLQLVAQFSADRRQKFGFSVVIEQGGATTKGSNAAVNKDIHTPSAANPTDTTDMGAAVSTDEAAAPTNAASTVTLAQTGDHAWLHRRDATQGI
ncbi:hypothetical protein LXA43DRAFT_1091790 [Ganoderma leucocontextum]|nr:hypothetical protein LXA43DRAFT_1097393 [Ganoderma leucocontextum]KAI1794741.1 hypothetical protein LXA43DRAFT_1091790 [Ganoderma leucocontextum]